MAGNLARKTHLLACRDATLVELTCEYGVAAFLLLAAADHLLVAAPWSGGAWQVYAGTLPDSPGAPAGRGWRNRPGGTGAPDLTSARCHDGDEPSAQRSARTVARPTCSLPRPGWTPMRSRTAG